MSTFKRVDPEGPFPIFTVIDADGNIISPIPNPPASEKAPPKKKSKTMDLEKLEDAIFNHPPIHDITNSKFCSHPRQEFLTLIKCDKTSFDDYTSQHTTSKEEALKYCWKTLNWRPSKSGKSVWVKHPKDPYH